MPSKRKKGQEKQKEHKGDAAKDESREACVILNPNLSWNLLSASGGGGYSHTLPRRVCAAQQGRDFEAPDLERGIHCRGVL